LSLSKNFPTNPQVFENTPDLETIQLYFDLSALLLGVISNNPDFLEVSENLSPYLPHSDILAIVKNSSNSDLTLLLLIVACLPLLQVRS